MKFPKLINLIITFFIVGNVSSQDLSSIKVMPFSVDQLLTQPIDKYDTLNIVDAPCTPASNDNYNNAITLTVGASAINGRTCGSMQAGEAKGCNSFATQSVWYKVTATATVTYIVIDAAGSNCYAGAIIWPATGLPTSNCIMIDCQSAVNGPSLNVFKLTGDVGKTYAIQVTYLPGILCGKEATFTIRAANSYGGTVNNPGAVNSCSTAYNGCYFTSTPTVSQVASTCTAYPLVTQSNLVNKSFFKFTTAPVNSNVLNFQDLLTSSCGSGNVSWFAYRLYDQYCNILSCGDLGNLQNNVACNQPYILEYSWEEVPGCSYIQHYPFQYVPTGTIGCGAPLPIELVNFNAVVKKNNTVNLVWSTANEVNNSHFLIERSGNGIYFEPVGKIIGNGNSNYVNSYYFDDELPGEGRYYYRLKQFDFNGDFKYSKTITVASTNHPHLFTISNPVVENVTLTLENEFANQAQITLIGSDGSIFATHMWVLSKGVNQKILSVKHLKPGVYTAIVTTEFFTCHQKIVKV